eukprot:gene31736-35825_t
MPQTPTPRPCYAIKTEVADPRATRFEFAAQKTMYGGKQIAPGDTVFVFASENAGGAGLVARARQEQRHLHGGFGVAAAFDERSQHAIRVQRNAFLPNGDKNCRRTAGAPRNGHSELHGDHALHVVRRGR